MDRLPIIGGAYSARSSIASAQRCINYFPEINPKDSPDPVTLYQRPGLRPLAAGPTKAPVRGLYQASDGTAFAVIGSELYTVGADWSLTPVGAITADRSNPVSMVDNRTELMLVDGSTSGWQVVLSGTTFSLIVDGTGTFAGADRVDLLDTYILWNMPGTTDFGSTLSGAIAFDGLYFAGKNGYSDNLQTLIVNKLELLLIGKLKSEIWYNAGNTNFPFARLPGTYIEHGIAAIHSLTSNDISVFWLGADLQGKGIVFRQRGYETVRISNHGVEDAIAKIADVSDAIGYTYQQQGHTFYVLTFPSGNQTWVFDEAIGDPTLAWHQRSWLDPVDGSVNRERANCFAVLHGVPVVGDWENGTLYELDSEYYYDNVAGLEGPIQCVRGFAHAMTAKSSQAPLYTLASNGLVLNYNEFWLNCEAGTMPDQDAPGIITLRWSDDRGKSWGNPVMLSAGALGETTTLPSIRAGGLSRDRVYEISHTIPAQVAISGAWIHNSIAGENRL
jgi:hypothetical protein